MINKKGRNRMADSTKVLKPREGLIVRDPISMVPLPAEGMAVDYTGRAGTYWRRRVMCGDCIEVKPVTKNRERSK
jgi:hypothetical protein